MTIQAFLKKHHSNEATDILAYLLGLEKTQLFLSDQKMTNKLIMRAETMLQKYKSGIPLAYILGDKYFYGLKLKVNKHVLIPRPETEWLVERAITGLRVKGVGYSKRRNAQLRMLDIGTGSGCIAISIAHALALNPKPLTLKITASDISNKALKVARTNAKIHKVDVKFIKSDLFNNIRGKFDVITANLPYVPQGMYELLYNNLKYEPRIAITDGGEVWDIYHKFFKQLPKHLKPNGTALLEIDDGSKNDIQKMLKHLLPSWKAKFYRDLGGLWRYVEINKKTAIS